MSCRLLFIVSAVAIALTIFARASNGQGYGTDVQNVMAPASGGMAGVSAARPQDVPSAIFGNPATMAQFDGTQFTVGGGWVEGYPTVDHQADRAGAAFTATSRTEGFLAPEIGVTQSLRPLGFNGTDEDFCTHITINAGVTAVPVSAFYDRMDEAPGHLVRFCFCKEDKTLDTAIERLRRHFRP